MNAAPQPVSAVKLPPAVFEQSVALGTAKCGYPIKKTFVLSFTAGAYIGFGIVLASLVGGSVPALKTANLGLQRIVLGAFGLPFGLLMTLISGGELFTGNTALCSAAWMEGKVSLPSVLKNWVVSYGGNLAGSLFLAFLVASSGVCGGAGAAAVTMANAKVSLTFAQAFTRGLLCNWLVCMAVYMAGAANDLAGKAVAIWFPISAFVAMGFEHSIANMALIPLAMMLGAPISLSSFLFGNLLPVTLGNMVAGLVLVAGMHSVAFGAPKE